MFRANLTTVSVCGGICRALPFYHVDRPATGYITLQEMIHYEIPFVKECVARFPLPYSDNDRHRLHSVTSDDLHNVTSNVTSEVVTMYPLTSQLASRLMACKQKHLPMFT